MFDIGAWEIMVIGVMALVILGPERLPGAIKSTISTMRNIKQMANGFKQEVVSQLDVHELHENLKKAESLGMQNIGGDLQKSVDELKAAAASVQEPYKKSSPNPEFTANRPTETQQKEMQHKENESIIESKQVSQQDQNPSQADLFAHNDSQVKQQIDVNHQELENDSTLKTARRPIDE